MDRAKAAVAATGQPIVDLSLGSADLPVADHILAAIEARYAMPVPMAINSLPVRRPFAKRWPLGLNAALASG